MAVGGNILRMFPRGAFGIGGRPGLGSVPSVCLGSLSVGGRMGGREEDIAFCKGGGEEDSYVQGDRGRPRSETVCPPARPSSVCPPSACALTVHTTQYLFGAKKGKGTLASQLVRGGEAICHFFAKAIMARDLFRRGGGPSSPRPLRSEMGCSSLQHSTARRRRHPS